MANYRELSFKSSEIETLMKGSLQCSSALPTRAFSDSISNVNLSFCTPCNIFIWVLIQVNTFAEMYIHVCTCLVYTMSVYTNICIYQILVYIHVCTCMYMYVHVYDFANIYIYHGCKLLYYSIVHRLYIHGTEMSVHVYAMWSGFQMYWLICKICKICEQKCDMQPENMHSPHCRWYRIPDVLPPQVQHGLLSQPVWLPSAAT